MPMLEEGQRRAVACLLAFLTVAVAFQCVLWFSVVSLERTYDREREEVLSYYFLRNPNDLSSIVRQVKKNTQEKRITPVLGSLR